VRPVRTEKSNLVYVGPTPDIGDLHCERVRPGYIRSVWEFSPEERESIAKGANLSVSVLTEPIPPMSMHLTREQGVGEDAPELRERLAEWEKAQA
jgi:hypothetical protein